MGLDSSRFLDIFCGKVSPQFVIPSAVEGSALRLSPATNFYMSSSIGWAEERGSRYQPASLDIFCGKVSPQICHPERSRGICFAPFSCHKFLHELQHRMSRGTWVSLPAALLDIFCVKVSPQFVIPSAVEGSALRLSPATNVFRAPASDVQRNVGLATSRFARHVLRES